MTTVFIDGEAGTTGLQIRQRLSGRGDIALLSIEATRRKDPGARREMLNEADISILCLPDEAAREAVALIDNPHVRIIDASSAHRVSEGWTYGFAEMSAAQPGRIAAATRVTNPGCYPQGLIALVRPLISAGIMGADYPLTYNAISGYSGGGRTMIEDYGARGAAATAYLPYGLTFAHKHTAEMQRYALVSRAPLFQPAVGNYAQGMLGAVPLFLDMLERDVSARDLHAVLATNYADCTFLDVAPLEAVERSAAISPQALNGSNRMRLHVFAGEARSQALLMAIYDNLGKGASGAAVQNLNIMTGADEAAGVDLPVAA